MNENKVLELISKIKCNQNDEESLMILWNEYGERLYRSFLKYFFKKKYNSPLEKEDFLSIIFISFKKAIKNFNLNNDKYSFIQYAHIATKSDAARYVKKFITKKHNILNNSLNNDDKYNNIVTNSLDKECLEKLDSEFKLSIINHYIKIYINKFPNSKLDRIIHLKLNDYKIYEISKILDISINQINYHINSFKKSLIIK